MKWIGALLLLVLLVASRATSQVPDDTLIVPGQRIAKWTLDMTMDDLVRMNGPRQPAGEIFGSREAVVRAEDPEFASADTWVHRWELLRLRVWTLGRDNQRIWGLQTSGPAYKTVRGIGNGAPRAAVEAAYGRPTAVTRGSERIDRLIYDDLGLAVVIPFNVVHIIVFRSGTAKELWRF